STTSLFAMAQSIYRSGTPVWLVDREQGWLPGEVKSFSTTDNGLPVVQVTDEDGQEITLKATFKDATAEEGGLPPLRNTAEFRTIKDLTRLPHLNEPSILEVIRNRYVDKCLYTYSGIVLIAVNPFSDMSAYYAPDVIRSYIGRNRDELDPHLFAVAEEAFSTMDRTGKAQSIIVSGESGSGKTESAKYIMRYLASVHARESLGPHTSGVSIEQQILATNPILEAFGNAKTARNDNSSRFGKYIQILFDTHQHIVGARIRTYLLERSRVTFQQSAERNYHIFYQLCAGASDEERLGLGLDADVTGFRYLCGMPSDPTQTSYAQDFTATCEALDVIGIDAGKRQAIFQLLAGLLHMGNMTIRSKRDTKDATMDEEDAALLRAAGLLGIDAKGFSKCTTTKQIDARGEKFSAARTVAQAAGVRDGVVQYIYSCLFNWLVARVNEGLSSGKEDLEATFIAVLDIYGFEQFEKNSFEQFCINYANEKLQQQFLSHVFKLDQAEYVEEGIPWNAIEFPDNQPCISLIEGKIGIISLLDEESRLAAGTDTTFVDKLNSQLKTPANKAVFKDHLHGNTAFKIVHYAGDVSYSVDGFLEKNRGIVPEEHLALLAESTNDFLREVLEDGTVSATADSAAGQAGKDDASSVVAAPKKGSNRKPTQASVFKSSLILLMRTLDQTDMHYIRCIKPNEDKQPWEFQNAHVLDQLRACGVLETVKISRAGYPSRMTYEEFVARYTLLLPRHVTRPYLRDPQRLTTIILQRTVGGGDKYQTGRTKIFLRARVLPILEGMRIEKQTSAILKVQSAARGTMARKRF
ncbi:P-loop containing nucleoside triphosphate hydrolase protein, partial [Schizophyllum commune]